MTEAEWLSCIDPEPMLAFLHGKVSERKLRALRVRAKDCNGRTTEAG
jgi:hypothetical protein